MRGPVVDAMPLRCLFFPSGGCQLCGYQPLTRVSTAYAGIKRGRFPDTEGIRHVDQQREVHAACTVG